MLTASGAGAGRRRQFLAAALLTAGGRRPALAAGQPLSARVIVVGGGFAGASCAGRLRQLMPTLAVTLIEPRPAFLTGPMSNAMLAGLRRPESIRQSPADLEARGVRWLRQAATEVDPVRLRVRTADGQWHQADRIVVAAGIAMRWDRIEGLDAARAERMPHGWDGDDSLLALRRGLGALPDGATVLIGAPPNPYRCPPAPYERASLIAWLLRARRGKVLIADAKDDFSLRGLFQFAWDVLYPGQIEWIARLEGGSVQRVDTRSGEVWLAGGERLRPDLASIIPAQRASALCDRADLVDASGWCPVEARSLQSLRHRQVHVIGDAAALHPVPKSAFAAHSSAALCAAAIVAALRGEDAPAPEVENSCFSLVAPDYGISAVGRYRAEGERMAVVSDGTSPLIADAALRAREARQFETWYQTLTRDSFR